MRRLGREEIEQRRAAGRARAERIAQDRNRKPTSPQLQQAIDRAKMALALVISDVELTTPVRERSSILRYDDWIFEDTQNPDLWVLGDSAAENDEEDDGLALACRFGGHTFALDGERSIADMAAHIASYVQDDVTDEIWKAWPVCPVHQHPMSPAVEAETAMWTCPKGGTAVPIGQLGSAAVSRPSSSSSSPPG